MITSASKKLIAFSFPIISLIAGCSDASFGESGYGPRGQGFIGSAYGYEDRKLGKGSYRVTYYEVTAEFAIRGARIRAAELCAQEGKGILDLPTQVDQRDGFVIAIATARCGGKPETIDRAKPGKRSSENMSSWPTATLQQRLIELDANIGAAKDELAAGAEGPPGQQPLTGDLAVFGAVLGVAGVAVQASTSAKLQKMEQERDAIIDILRGRGEIA